MTNKKGRTYRIRNRKKNKYLYLDIPILLKLFSGRDDIIINVLPRKTPEDYRFEIMKLFELIYYTEFKLVYKNKELLNNKSLFSQNIYRDTILNILFSINIPEIPFTFPDINDILIFDTKLNEIIELLLNNPLPNNFYLKGKELLNFAFNKMNFKWLDKTNNDSIYKYSRYGGMYKTFCSVCKEGCYLNHTCNTQVLRFLNILPQLENGMNECCNELNYSILFN